MYTRSTRSLSSFLSLALLALATLCGAARAVVYVRADAPGPTRDGKSWATAYTSLPEALAATWNGGDVWVAAGTYTGAPDAFYGSLVSIDARTRLYGGFAGNETQLSQRDIAANPTILDGQGKDFQIRIWNAESARLDGFTIRSGRALGKGVLNIIGGQPVIANNTFLDCRNDRTRGDMGQEITPGPGGAIYFSSSCPTIYGNRFVNNVAGTQGGAIYAPGLGYARMATIANNLFVGNAAQDGSAVCLTETQSTDDFLVFNNTFAANVGPETGSAVTIGAGTFANNIVAFNAAGVRMGAGLNSHHNDVFGNAAYDTLGTPRASSDNFGADPLFVDRTAGDFHLLTSSPCVDAGATEVPLAASRAVYFVPLFDAEERERVMGASADVGAFERVGAPVYRPWLGHDYFEAIAGRPITPVPHVSVTLFSGRPAPDYNGPVTLTIKPGTGVPGASVGGTATVHAVNGLATFPSAWIDKPGPSFVLRANIGAEYSDSYQFTVGTARAYVRLGGSNSNDGFTWATAKGTLQDALAVTGNGGEVWVAAGTYTSHRIESRGVYGGFRGDETALEQRDTRANPVIFTGTVLLSGSIKGSARLDGVTVRGGAGAMVWTLLWMYGGTGFFAGGCVHTTGEAFVANCRIEGGNTVQEYVEHDPLGRGTTSFGPGPGGGVYASGGKLTLVNNVIVNNTATDGGGVYYDYATGPNGPRPENGAPEGSIVNNTIVGNTGGTAVVVVSGSKVTMGNNIIAFNNGAPTGAVALPGINDVFASPGLTGSMAANPLFADRAAGDFRPRDGSPAIDAGDDTLVTGFPMDLDGRPRIQGARVDLGAYEAVPPVDTGQAVRCLKIAAGLLEATAADISQLGGTAGAPGDGITLLDALSSLRRAMIR